MSTQVKTKLYSVGVYLPHNVLVQAASPEEALAAVATGDGELEPVDYATEWQVMGADAVAELG